MRPLEPCGVEMEEPKPKLWLYAFLFLLGAGPLLAVSAVAYLMLPGLMAWPAPDLASLSPEQRERVYAVLAEQVGGIWDAVPEPKVGRMLQMNIQKMFKETLVASNSAGLRDPRKYLPKDGDTFRIVLLGDSFVMGTAGLERDRIGPQMQVLLRDIYGTINEKKIEVYSVGLSSWNTVAEAAYLSARLSAYEPDIILTISVPNDITDNTGVTGIGSLASAFSTARRDWGSGVMRWNVPPQLGMHQKTLLHSGLGPTSQEYYLEAMGAMKELETLQSKRGGKMMISTLTGRSTEPNLFQENFLDMYEQLDLQSPYLALCYFLQEGNRLPHDPHPNRAGYGIIVAHLLHAMAKLGWIPSSDALPPIDPRLSLDLSPAPDSVQRRALQSEAVANMKRRLDFSNLERSDLKSFLGGVLPGIRSGIEQILTTPPFGTLRTVFLLRNDSAAKEAYVTIQIPPRVELFPLTVSLYVEGELGDSVTVETLAEQTDYTLRAPIPESKRAEMAIEIKLLADRYWSVIDRRDEGMRSYRLIEAGLE